MASKTRVKEVYCYKDSNGRYIIDMVAAGNRFLKAAQKGLTEEEKDEFLKTLESGEDKYSEPSKKSFQVYNRKPEQRMLAKSSTTIFNSYVKNLQSKVSESSSDCYKRKVANLLRSVSDLLDDEEPVVIQSAITPDLAVTPDVSLSMIERIEETLGTKFDTDNLTFWFQDQKWQLTKEGYEQTNLPSMKRPTTARNVEGTMQYMMNLIGAVCEVTYDESNPVSFRFVDGDDVYRVSHVYTGDYNVFKQGVDVNLGEG